MVILECHSPFVYKIVAECGVARARWRCVRCALACESVHTMAMRRDQRQVDGDPNRIRSSPTGSRQSNSTVEHGHEDHFAPEKHGVVEGGTHRRVKIFW
jgi:hypothetical protein